MPLVDDSREPYLTCPYDPTHQILSFRMAWHVHRCEKNFPLSDLVICKFNTCHRIKPAELENHHLSCENRTEFERLTVEPEGFGEEVPPMEMHKNRSDAVTDEWNLEANYTTYDPQIGINRRNIMPIPVNLSKGQRKQYEVEQRGKIRQEKDRRKREKDKRAMTMGSDTESIKSTSTTTKTAVDRKTTYTESTREPPSIIRGAGRGQFRRQPTDSLLQPVGRRPPPPPPSTSSSTVYGDMESLLSDVSNFRMKDEGEK